VDASQQYRYGASNALFIEAPRLASFIDSTPVFASVCHFRNINWKMNLPINPVASIISSASRCRAKDNSVKWPTAGVVKIRRIAIGRGRPKALSAGTVKAGSALRRGCRRD
jgi:hypothetical protein